MEEVPIIQNISDAITIGLTEELKKYIDDLPVDLLDEDIQKKVFVYLMKKALKSPLGLGASNIIIQRWIDSDIENNPPSSPVYFLMQTDIDKDIIYNMVRSLENWDYVNYVIELIHQDSSPEVEMAIDRLNDIYGTQTQDVYQLLLAQIVKQNKEEGTYNHVIKRKLENMLDKSSDYAPIPPWVKNYYGEPLISEEDLELEIDDDLTLEGIIPSSAEAADMVLKQLKETPLVSEAFKKYAKKPSKSGKEIDEEYSFSCPMVTPEQRKYIEKNLSEIRKTFIASYNSASVKEKVRLLGNLIEDISEDLLRKDEKIFRIFGPTNPVYGQVIIDPENDSAKYGGCRMLTCIEFENEDEFGIIDEENPYTNIEWFTGNCEYCHKKIAKKIYALRRPLTFGGWKGTFCSFKCLRDVVPFNDLLNHAIINQIEQQLSEIGIQDRVVTGEGEINNEELQKELDISAEKEIDGELPKVIIETLPTNFLNLESL